MSNIRPLPLNGITVVFDLDGTLVNTAPDLQAALNFVLEKHGYCCVEAPVSQDFIGHGAKAMLLAGLAHQDIRPAEATLDLMFTEFLAYYADNIDTYSAPYPGCEAALERLRDAGAVLAVCTNKMQFLADLLLERLGLKDYFAAIVGADSVKNRKPHADHILETLNKADTPHYKAVMIGDSHTDERAARNAELPFLFVPFGYGPIDNALKEERYILSHFKHLSADKVLKILSAQAADS